MISPPAPGAPSSVNSADSPCFREPSTGTRRSMYSRPSSLSADSPNVACVPSTLFVWWTRAATAAPSTRSWRWLAVICSRTVRAPVPRTVARIEATISALNFVASPIFVVMRVVPLARSRTGSSIDHHLRPLQHALLEVELQEARGMPVDAVDDLARRRGRQRPRRRPSQDLDRRLAELPADVVVV